MVDVVVAAVVFGVVVVVGVIFIVVGLICVVCWLTVVGCGVVVAFVHNLHVCNMVVSILDLICDSVSMSLFCYLCHFFCHCIKYDLSSMSQF